MRKRLLALLLLTIMVSIFGCTGLSTTATVTSTTTTSTTTPTSATFSSIPWTTTITSIPSSETTTVPSTTTNPDTTGSDTTPTTLVPVDYEYVFGKDTETDLVVDLTEDGINVLSVEDQDGIPVGIGIASVNAGIASFVASALTANGFGNVDFTLVTDKGNFSLRIEVSDFRLPYLVSPSSFTYVEGTDAVLTFEMYGGSFFGMSGNDITEANYSFSGNQLTIDYDYIIGKFTESPERTALILGYTLTYPGGATIGYIYIHKPQD